MDNLEPRVLRSGSSSVVGCHKRLREEQNFLIPEFSHCNWLMPSSIMAVSEQPIKRLGSMENRNQRQSTELAQKIGPMKHSIGFDWVLLSLIGFGNRTQSNSHTDFLVWFCLISKLNQTQLLDQVRMGSIEFSYQRVWLVLLGLVDLIHLCFWGICWLLL